MRKSPVSSDSGDFPLLIQFTQVFLKLFLEQLSGVARSYKRGKGEIVYIGVLYIMPFQVFFPVGERDRLVLIEVVIVEVVAKLISGSIFLPSSESPGRNRRGYASSEQQRQPEPGDLSYRSRRCGKWLQNVRQGVLTGINHLT